jgi:hypothetical protein
MQKSTRQGILPLPGGAFPEPGFPSDDSVLIHRADLNELCVPGVSKGYAGVIRTQPEVLDPLATNTTASSMMPDPLTLQ